MNKNTTNYNFPVFRSSNPALDEIYAYRCEVFKRHIEETPFGYVITEFLPPVRWAGPYNTISCAASHHFRDGRWLDDKKLLEDYAAFWFKAGNPRSYSFPAADSILELAKVSGNTQLACDLYNDLRGNYSHWQEEKGTPDGFFIQSDNRDGMEYSISGQGYRPTINSYMYAEASALAKIADMRGDVTDVRYFSSEARKIADFINNRLWNGADSFYETLHADGKPANVRELIGYIPWIYSIPPAGRESVFAELWDSDGFYAKFGPTTAERRHPDFMKEFPHECLWNGPSWPFATSQTLTAMIRVLHDYPQCEVTESSFMKLLDIYVSSQRDEDGSPCIDENLEPDTGVWLARDILRGMNRSDKARGEHYNHSSFIDLIISGVCGILPETDGTIRIAPLGGSMDEFSISDVVISGHRLSLSYTKGNKYSVSIDNGKKTEFDKEIKIHI